MAPFSQNIWPLPLQVPHTREMEQALPTTEARQVDTQINFPNQ